MPKAPRKTGYELSDSPFFRLTSRKKLASLLRVSETTLADLSSGRQQYVRKWKHKKFDRWLNEAPKPESADLYRPIDIPEPVLKATQGRLALLLARVEPPDFLFSPVKGRSYVQNAAHHVGSRAFWLLDVANYFPSCTANNVARFFHRDLECSPDVTAVLVKITTFGGCLPQGSPCSPILAYYSNRPMWLAIQKCVEQSGCKLSVYADDITVSGEVVLKSVIWEIKKIIHGSGLALKKSKEVSLIKSQADITGVIVKKDGTHLPNRQLKKLVELEKERGKMLDPKLRAKLDHQIAGRLAQRRQVEQSQRST